MILVFSCIITVVLLILCFYRFMFHVLTLLAMRYCVVLYVFCDVRFVAP